MSGDVDGRLRNNGGGGGGGGLPPLSVLHYFPGRAGGGDFFGSRNFFRLLMKPGTKNPGSRK
jgi:hypothetical protein